MTTIAEIQELHAEAARSTEVLKALLAESVRRDAEYRAAAEKRDAEYKAMLAEERRKTEESQRKTDDAIRKMANEFNSQWGRFVEALCANQVVPLLKSRGIEVHHIGPRVKRSLPKGGYYEIDILVVNDDTIVLFEVKTTLRPDDVKWFVEKLGHAREMFHEYREYRILGGVAYLREDSFAAQNAQKQGLFTILATGNGAAITNPKEFEPKEW